MSADDAPRPASTTPMYPMIIGLGSDLMAVLRLRDVRLAIGLLFFVQFGLGATNPLLELFVFESVGGSPEEVRSTTALLFTVIAASALVASPAWGWVGDRLGHGRTLLFTTLASALALAIHGIAAGLVGLCLARVLLGVASSGMNTAAFAVASAGTRTSERGSAMGSVFSARALAVSTGAMVGGALSAGMGRGYGSPDIRAVLEWFILNLHSDAKAKGSSQRLRLADMELRMLEER